MLFYQNNFDEGRQYKSKKNYSIGGKVKGKVLLVLAIVGMFIMPMMPVKVKADNTTLATHYWHDKKLYAGIWSVAKYANDDAEMNKVISNQTTSMKVYNWLKDVLFKGCSSMRSFYQRMEELCKDARDPDEGNPSPDLYRWQKKLSVIVQKVLEKRDNQERASLFCHQQAILLAAAIKARFSVPYGSTYVLKSGYGDFTFYFNMGQDGYPSGHVQLVVDKWNGSDWFYDRKNHTWFNKWEIDTWEDQYRGWISSYGWKDNSKMWTSTSRAKDMEEEALPEFPYIESIWYYYWLEENENKDIEELYLLMENEE